MVKEPPMRTPPSGQRTPAPVPDSLPVRFARLEAQFDLLKARVRQAQQLASLGTIAPTLAHEVNNLLTPIIAYATSAVDRDDEELMRKALQITLRNARIVVHMADRLLKLSAAKPAERAAVDVRTAIENAYAGLCRDLSRDGITFSVEVPSGLTVWADELQIQQVLFNLFLNAREAMKHHHHGRLSVRAFDLKDHAPSGPAPRCTSEAEGRSPRRAVVIEVSNSGRPIPPDRLPHIFDAFESTKPVSSADAKCSGLGLALCRDLIQEHQGTIRVTSDAARGTTFTITLPTSE